MEHKDEKGKSDLCITEIRNQIINGTFPEKKDLDSIVRNTELTIGSPSEVQSFVSSTKNKGHYLAFQLAIYTGMRQEELLGL